MRLKHVPTGNEGMFVKEYYPPQSPLTNIILLDDGRQYYAPASEFVVTLSGSTSALRKRPKHEIIETPSYKEIWDEHDRRMAEIDSKYNCDKIIIVIAFVIASALIVWITLEPDFFGL